MLDLILLEKRGAPVLELQWPIMTLPNIVVVGRTAGRHLRAKFSYLLHRVEGCRGFIQDLGYSRRGRYS